MNVKYCVLSLSIIFISCLHTLPDLKQQEKESLVPQLEAKNTDYSTGELAAFTGVTTTLTTLAFGASYKIGSGCQDIPEQYAGCVITTSVFTGIGIPLAVCTLLLGRRIVQRLFVHCCGSQQ